MIKGFGAAVVALVACPCHLPLTLPLLLSLTSGTAVGLWLATDPKVVWLFSFVPFVGGAALAMKWLTRAQDDAQCPSPVAHCREITVSDDRATADYPTHLQNQKAEI